MEQERDAELAAMDVSRYRIHLPRYCCSSTLNQPRNPLSPNAISPGGTTDLEENPFDSEFNDYDDELDDTFGIATPQNEAADTSNFAVLNSSKERSCYTIHLLHPLVANTQPSIYTYLKNSRVSDPIHNKLIYTSLLSYIDICRASP